MQPTVSSFLKQLFYSTKQDPRIAACLASKEGAWRTRPRDPSVVGSCSVGAPRPALLAPFLLRSWRHAAARGQSQELAPPQHQLRRPHRVKMPASKPSIRTSPVV